MSELMALLARTLPHLLFAAIVFHGDRHGLPRVRLRQGHLAAVAGAPASSTRPLPKPTSQTHCGDNKRDGQLERPQREH